MNDDFSTHGLIFCLIMNEKIFLVRQTYNKLIGELFVFKMTFNLIDINHLVIEHIKESDQECSIKAIKC